MSKSSSFQRLPVEVDPFRLVEQGRLLDGRIPISDFPRLKELVFQQSNKDGNEQDESLITVHLEFTRTDTGLPAIKGDINSDLQMLCQRCLDVKIESFNSQFEVVLVTSDEQAERVQGGFDTWLVVEQKVFLQDFIEDEILLALPLSVTHDDCQPARELIEALPESATNEEQEVSEKKNPFAVLKDLKLD